MKLTDVLAWLSLVIGLPAFLALFLQGAWIQGILVLILVALSLGVLWYLALPEFTVTALEKVLTIRDGSAECATLVQRARMRPNHKGLTEWWVRNMGGDGRIVNILIDGKAPSEVDQRGGLISVCKRYQHPLPRWRTFDTTVTCDMLRSYSQPQEALIHTDAYATKELTMIIEFPAERPCLEASGVITFSGEQRKQIGTITLSEGRRRAVLHVKRPKLGAQYHLEWEW
jgi:hypothetical protein